MAAVHAHNLIWKDWPEEDGAWQTTVDLFGKQFTAYAIEVDDHDPEGSLWKLYMEMVIYDERDLQTIDLDGRRCVVFLVHPGVAYS